MPELPEVETVRRGLVPGVVNRVIAAVAVQHPRAVRRHVPGAEDFAGLLRGQRILAVRRRGKYLWLPLSSGDALVAHLGMSGQLLLTAAATPVSAHLRVRLIFDDGDPELRFVDQRTFGGLFVAAGGEQQSAGAVPPVLAHIAPDPLDDAFDDAVFSARLRRRRTGLKRALLDQTLVSGIGNIYADEALWRARLHGDRPTETLRPQQVRELLVAVRSVLREALGAGGTSFDALYVDVNGSSGYFDRELAVYGREGKPCRRCGTAIVREPFMNRSSFRCPRCQPRPRRRLATSAS